MATLAMTTANKITILRILLVPFFIVQVLYYTSGHEEWHRLLALLAFAVAAVSDGVDGFIARHYNQRSELGAMLDPLADKLLLLSGTVLLSLNNLPHLQRLPLWLVTTVVSRDILLFIGSGVIYYTCGKVVIRPRILGKIATVLQMITVLWTLLKWDPAWLWYWSLGAALFTGGSGLWYVLDGVRQLSASPRSSASIPTPPPASSLRRD
jgi:cardiolipin synthase